MTQFANESGFIPLNRASRGYLPAGEALGMEEIMRRPHLSERREWSSPGF
jgi:hypothetical protein